MPLELEEHRADLKLFLIPQIGWSLVLLFLLTGWGIRLSFFFPSSPCAPLDGVMCRLQCAAGWLAAIEDRGRSKNLKLNGTLQRIGPLVGLGFAGRSLSMCDDETRSVFLVVC